MKGVRIITYLAVVAFVKALERELFVVESKWPAVALGAKRSYEGSSVSEVEGYKGSIQGVRIVTYLGAPGVEPHVDDEIHVELSKAVQRQRRAFLNPVTDAC